MNAKCVIEITRKCFNSCDHCYLSCNASGRDASFKDILSISKKLSKPINTGSRLIKFDIKSITGGDCFLYSDHEKNLIDVVDLLAKKSNKIDLHVSGWLKSPEFLNNLKSKNISYFISYTPHMCNYKNLFEKCFSDLDSINGNICIDIIAESSHRARLLREIILILKKYGYAIKNVAPEPIFSNGRKEVKVLFKELFPIGRGSRIVKRTSGNYFCQYSNKQRSYFLYISSNGDIFPCARAPATKLIKIANILKDNRKSIANSFLEYIKNKEIFIRKFDSKCQTCIDYFNDWINEKKFIEASEKIGLLEKKCKMLDAKGIALNFLRMAEKEKNHKFIAEFCKDLSIISRIDGNLKDSKELIYRSLKMAKKSNAKTQEANAYGNLGILNLFYKNYKGAIKYHKKAIKIHYANNDKKRISANLSFLGVNYMFLKKYRKSVGFFKEAIKVASDIDYKEGIADTMYNFAVLYTHLRNYREAKRCLDKAGKLFKKISNTYKLRQIFKLNAYIKDIENGKKEDIVLSNNKRD